MSTFEKWKLFTGSFLNMNICRFWILNKILKNLRYSGRYITYSYLVIFSVIRILFYFIVFVLHQVTHLRDFISYKRREGEEEDTCCYCDSNADVEFVRFNSVAINLVELQLYVFRNGSFYSFWSLEFSRCYWLNLRLFPSRGKVKKKKKLRDWECNSCAAFS